jgi:hypothetical protein
MMMNDHDDDAQTSIPKKSKSSDIFSFWSIIMMVGCIGAATSMYVLKNATLRHEADMIGKMRCVCVSLSPLPKDMTYFYIFIKKGIKTVAFNFRTCIHVDNYKCVEKY